MNSVCLALGCRIPSKRGSASLERLMSNDLQSARPARAWQRESGGCWDQRPPLTSTIAPVA